MKKLTQNIAKPLVLFAVLALLAGLWAGLIRIGWQWPAIRPALPMSHGPLMVSGFFGTLILVERSVALKRWWAYLGPAFSGAGGLLIWTAYSNVAGIILLVLGSLWMVAIFLVIVRQVWALYTITMSVGAVCWLVGNLMWFFGFSISQVVYWWAGFLVLTIAGERLELSRVTRPSPVARKLFLSIVGLVVIGLIGLLVNLNIGLRLFSLGFIALSGWLYYYDVSRRTVRMKGLPRFMAFSLLAGYAWLAISGILMFFFGYQPAGPRYDAMLHAVFVGFVVSMVFGHAPMIFPAVLRVPLVYSPVFYLPLVFLHGSLLTRILADLAGLSGMRLYSGLTNALAILVYAGLVAYSILRK